MGLSEKYSTSIANLALKQVPTMEDYLFGSTEGAATSPPASQEALNYLDVLDQVRFRREYETPEEKTMNMLGNLPLPADVLLQLTRGEALRQVAKGLVLKNIIPKSDLIQRVKGALKGILMLGDEELAPIGSINWEPNMDALMNRAAGEGPMGVAKAENILLNPTKGTEKKLTWTMLEEALHTNQWEDSDLWINFQKGTKFLQNLGKRSQGLIDKETQYIYDPAEIHAKYQVNRRIRDYPGQIAPEAMRDTYYNAGVEQAAKKMQEFGKSYPRYTKEAEYEEIRYRKYLMDLLNR